MLPDALRISEALAERRVFADPPLSTPGLDWETRIYFRRTPASRDPLTRTARFPAERDLEDFLVANFDYLFPGLRLLDRQYRVDSGQIDLLAQDRDGYVVIELKVADASKDLVHKVDAYMDDVARWVEAKGTGEAVRGIVVTTRVNETMRAQLEAQARADGRRIDWLEYRIDLTLQPVAGSDGTRDSGSAQ